MSAWGVKPQVKSAPDWMSDMGVGRGMVSAPFGNCKPQQDNAKGASWDVGMAQAWWRPADISVNEPCGGVAWPSELFPQQAIAASWRRAQAKWRPADIWVKAAFVGGFRLPARSGSSPQQAIAPFSRRAQAWVLPADIWVKATSAGIGMGVGWAVEVGVGGVGWWGWAQADRTAIAAAAQRAASLGSRLLFCLSLNKRAVGVAMAARLSNVGCTPR